MIRALLGVALAIGAIASVSNAPAATTHQVYVWQRQWTPPLRTALVQSRDLFDGVRVLVAQAGRKGGWRITQADPQAFAGSAQTRIAVIRYDGTGSAPDAATLAPFLGGLLQRWRAGGAAFAGVEIDYDCPSARLADYAAQLRALREMLPAEIRLSITALPAWLHAPALDAVLAASDEAVLQVHAVENPASGLFDAQRAERWLRAFAPHAVHGFRIALPAYGSRVRFGDDGRALAVESEMPVDRTNADDARELHVDPAEVARLLNRLAAAPPGNWNGVVWFRLPLPNDRRAWTLAALRAVIGGRTPTAALSAEAIERANGASDIVAHNRGIADADVAAVRVTAEACSAGDATNGWQGAASASGWRFAAVAPIRLRAGAQRVVGWVRCTRVAGADIEDTSTEGIDIERGER